MVLAAEAGRRCGRERGGRAGDSRPAAAVVIDGERVSRGPPRKVELDVCRPWPSARSCGPLPSLPRLSAPSGTYPEGEAFEPVRIGLSP